MAAAVEGGAHVARAHAWVVRATGRASRHAGVPEGAGRVVHAPAPLRLPQVLPPAANLLLLLLSGVTPVPLASPRAARHAVCSAARPRTQARTKGHRPPLPPIEGDAALAPGLRAVAASLRAVPRRPRVPGALVATTPYAVLPSTTGTPQVPPSPAVRPAPRTRVLRRARRRAPLQVPRLPTETVVVGGQQREVGAVRPGALIVPRTAAEPPVAVAMGGKRRLTTRHLSRARAVAAAPRRETAARVPRVVSGRACAAARVVQAVRLRGVRPLLVQALGTLLLLGVGRRSSGGPRMDAAARPSVRPPPPLSRTRRRAAGPENTRIGAVQVTPRTGGRRARARTPRVAATGTRLLAPRRPFLPCPEDPGA